jgi:HAD superfamily hydrolase (TIGR01458 family)
MPHAIEWSFATPKIRAFRPSSNPIRSSDPCRQGHGTAEDTPPGDGTYDDRVSQPSEPLHGVRGLLLDLDGVIVLKGRAIPGAADAVRSLDRRGIPYRIVTNTSLLSRESLARFGESIGLAIPPERILSGLSISAAYTARHFPGQPLYVLASEDARREFDGQSLLSDEEAGDPDASAAAVVVGDSPEVVNHPTLNRAFRLIRGGARLIGMHKNQWWLTPDGPTIDSGAIVAALEYSTGVRATIVGKPAREFFMQAAAELQAELSARDDGRSRGRRVSRSEFAMVGDDILTDVFAAQRAGFRGVFVLTGKHDRADLAEAVRAKGRSPDLVAASLAEVVAALD